MGVPRISRSTRERQGNGDEGAAPSSPNQKMLRLPDFTYRRPQNVREAAAILAGEGANTKLVAGGTDLWPKMKRRQMEPRVVVGLRHLAELRGESGSPASGVTLGPNLTLCELERHPMLLEKYRAVAEAARSISSPPLKTMGTLGGNLCVDTRCFYYDQTYEWRQSIHFCLKKDGDTCWVAPGSPRCWAVSSTDLAPVMLALNARIRLLSKSGERAIDASQMYNTDGIAYLTKRPDEIVTAVDIPPIDGDITAFQKLRRRGSIDFPILNVAVWLRPAKDRKTVEAARIAIGGITSAPFLSAAAANALLGRELTRETINAAAHAARLDARPLDNTDLNFSWRRSMVEVWVRRTLEEAAGQLS
jgi:4-hydroxybenzoyl-CoA reductase subunit beta